MIIFQARNQKAKSWRNTKSKRTRTRRRFGDSKCKYHKRSWVRTLLIATFLLFKSILIRSTRVFHETLMHLCRVPERSWVRIYPKTKFSIVFFIQMVGSKLTTNNLFRAFLFVTTGILVFDCSKRSRVRTWLITFF